LQQVATTVKASGAQRALFQARDSKSAFTLLRHNFTLPRHIFEINSIGAQQGYKEAII